MNLFANIVCSLKYITILTRRSILRSIMGCGICPGYFFKFTFSIDLFISPKIFKNRLNVYSAHKCLFKVYTRSIALGVGPVQFWQQGYHNNVCHVVLRFWLTLGRSLHYFLFLLLLNLNILCSILCGTPNRCYIYGSCCKTLVCNCAND